MGLEDYRVILKPTGVGLSVLVVRRTLEEMGFRKDRPRVDYGAARLAAPPEGEAAFTLDDGTQIIEALIHHQEIPPQVGVTLSKTVQQLKRLWQQVSERLQLEISGGPTVDYVSVRFAICQPNTAAEQFLEVVQNLSHKHQMSISHDGIEYAPEQFEEFRVRAEEQVWQQKRMWRNMFEGDMEERRMRVEEAWAYFLQKHSHLVLQTSTALGLHSGHYGQDDDEQNLRHYDSQ